MRSTAAYSSGNRWSALSRPERDLRLLAGPIFTSDQLQGLLQNIDRMCTAHELFFQSLKARASAACCS
jgi:hypothetical protein